MQRKSNIALILATIVSMLTLAAVPVAAQGGSDDSTSGSTTTQTSTSGSSTETETEVETHNETETNNQLATVREQAKQMLETERQDHKGKTEDQRKTACEAKSTEINNRVANYSRNAKKHLDVFIGLLTKVQAFHDSKQLNVASYASLLATAQSKQADAQAAVDALAALNVNIDCTQPDPAQSVASVKTAVNTARAALQAFRASIKDLIVALKGASTTAETEHDTTTNTTTTTGGAQ